MMSRKKFIDPIMEEVRKLRDEHAKKYNYDRHKILQALLDSEKKIDPKRFADFKKNPKKPKKLKND